MEVYGKTAPAVQVELQEVYAKHLRDPVLTVTFQKSNIQIAELKKAITTAPRGQSRLVPIKPDDFGGSSVEPLAGIAWQGRIEAKAFQAGGADFSLPACTLPDFLARRTPESLPQRRPPLQATATDLHAALPDCVSQTLVEAVPPMMRQMRQVAVEECVVYGAETRSSSPVRITRDGSFQSPSVRGLYPIGEGSGYAGGIVTCAIDGLRAAESLLEGRES